MGKIRTAGLILILFGLFFTNPSWVKPIAKRSPLNVRIEQERGFNLISSSIESEQATPEVIKIQKFLEYRSSPLAKNSVDFYLASKEYNFEPYLLPAIAGVESSFGQAMMANSYNPFGWNNGRYFFKNFKEAIFTVAKSLREKYVPNGEINPQKIGKTYATSWPTWIPKVEGLVSQVKNTPVD